MTDQIILYNHKTNCRICLCAFTTINLAISIGAEIEKRFQQIFNQNLISSPQLSNNICVSCNLKLKDISIYIQSVQIVQENLLKFIKFDGKNVSEEICVKLEPEDVNDVLQNYSIKDLENLKQEEVQHPVEQEDVTKVIRKYSREESSTSDEDIPLNKLRNIKSMRNSSQKVKKPAQKRRYRKVMCGVCGKIVSCEFVLKSHMKSVHSKIKDFECDLCDFLTSTKRNIFNHVLTHAAIESRRIHKCSKCNYISLRRTQLRIHEEGVHSTQSFSCYCGAVLKSKRQLGQHTMRIHKGIRRHHCEYCDKSYVLKSELRAHTNIVHIKNPQQYQCKECLAYFISPRQLSSHRVKVHREKIKCKFDGCKLEFALKSRLDEHMKMHTGNRDVQCHVCEKAYYTLKDLRIHLDVAHQRKTFFCEFCEFSNSRKDYLGNHLKSVHKLDGIEKTEALKRAKCVTNEV